MNYELAKKLKDAGFPQEMAGFRTFHERTIECNGLCDDSHFIKIPTLSELIAACGEDLSVISRESNTWSAISVHAFTGPEDIIGIGNTPEEAVANLWLQINKPSPQE